MSDETGGSTGPGSEDPTESVSSSGPPEEPGAADPTQALPVTPATAVPGDPPPPDDPAPWYKNPAVVIPSALALVLLIVLAFVLLGDDDDATVDVANTSTTVEPGESSSTSSAETTSPSVTTASSQPAQSSSTSAGPVAPSGAQEDLNEAVMKFNDFIATSPGDPPTYNMDYRTGVGTHECLIVSGSDVQRVAFEDDCELDETASNCGQCTPRSVTDLFDTIQSFIDNGVPFTVSYDRQDGYPTFIESLDAPPDDADRGFQITMGTVGQGTGD